MKVGFIAILGRPNAGKSTLINALLSKKVSIVSPKAQTTRDHVLGILNEKGRQMVFVDTPGIHYGSEALDKHMRSEAFSSSRDAEAILYLIDASSEDFSEDVRIVKSLKREAGIFIVLNKIDLIRPEKALEAKAKLGESLPNCPLIEASLIRNFGIKEIKDAIEPFLVEGEPYFPEGMLTDKDKAFQAKEIIRGQLLHFLKQEIPHQAAVRIDSLEKKDGGYFIKATIAVEKENHKAIVIGAKGQMIKKISMSSRHELERMWHEHITNLAIEVSYLPGWRNDMKKLQEFGYGEE